MEQCNPNNLNGVDVCRLQETVMQAASQPQKAKFTFSVHNRWMDGGHNKSSIQSFFNAGTKNDDRKHSFEIEADEPEILLGHDQGANPVEFVLHALAACLTTSMVYHAAGEGIQIKSIECDIEGDLDARGFMGIANVRKGYSAIRVNFKIGADVSAEQLQRICNLGPKFSPVYDIVTNPVPVEIRCTRA